MNARYNPDSERVIRQLESLIENAKSFLPCRDASDEEVLNPSDGEYAFCSVWYDDIICCTKAIEIIRFAEYDKFEEE